MAKPAAFGNTETRTESESAAIAQIPKGEAVRHSPQHLWLWPITAVVAAAVAGMVGCSRPGSGAPPTDGGGRGSRLSERRPSEQSPPVSGTAAVAAVLDFDDYVQARYGTKGRLPLNLIRLWPLVIFSEGRFESLMASESVSLDSQVPYQERLRQAQTDARQRLSRLQQRLTTFHEFAIYVRGVKRGTFSVTRIEMDSQRGDMRFLCEGELQLDGPAPQDVQRWLDDAVALSPAVSQGGLWTAQLTREQQRELDQATASTFSRARTFVPAQRQLRQVSGKTVVVNLNKDGGKEVFRMARGEGQPCKEMTANFLGTWVASSWKTVRASVSLGECVGGIEAAGEDNFSPLFVDIDGDRAAEILMTEGRHESHEWSLYRLAGGVLQKLLRIGAYGS